MLSMLVTSERDDGDRGERYEQAAVPGSSDPSGQSQ